MDTDKFIFCLEGVSDIDTVTTTEVVKTLEIEFDVFSHAIDQMIYFNRESHWLLDRFP